MYRYFKYTRVESKNKKKQLSPNPRTTVPRSESCQSLELYPAHYLFFTLAMWLGVNDYIDWYTHHRHGVLCHPQDIYYRFCFKEFSKIQKNSFSKEPSCLYDDCEIYNYIDCFVPRNDTTFHSQFSTLNSEFMLSLWPSWSFSRFFQTWFFSFLDSRISFE